MKIAVVLGYWLNNDGTGAPMLIERCEQAIQLIKDEHPDKIILSGGFANPKAGKSEASVMYDYLISKGVSPDLLIKEEKSKTTHQNAIYSCEIAKNLGVTTLIISSSLIHYTAQPYNTIKFFSDELVGTNVKLMIYTTVE